MKKILLPLLLLGRLIAAGQVGHAPAPPPAASDSSAIGNPVGEKASKTIGPEGGRIVSADGMVELQFPPGALTTATDIGVQPVENKGATGLGNAYACSPDGLQFQKSVQLTIHYTDSVGKDISPLFHTIRWQDNKGHWSEVEQTKVDSVARTITGHIRHFSAYSDGTKWSIVYPGKVKVGGERVYQLIITGTYPDGVKYGPNDGAGEESFWRSHPIQWAVNGIPGGNEKVGTISPLAAGYPANYAEYIAPKAMPPSNAQITAEYLGDWEIQPNVTVSHPKTRLTTILFDDYHYAFTGFDKLGLFHMVDSASCDIRLESSGALRMSNIQNPVPWSDWPKENKDKKCTYEYPDKTGWKGMVQIEGVASHQFDVEEGGKVTVMIHLKTTMGSSPSYIEHCKKTRNVPSYPVFAQPMYIQFDIRQDGSILVSYKGATGEYIINDLEGEQGFSVIMSHIDWTIM